ncbi:MULTISPECIES: DUF397 domain-containing protein [Streptomyces]|uniref:DUF397 domain-containing protein n=1 Tax=Streptomyces TaxID=1883 RepID=UPI0022494ED7|nr:DUF397 domain-containing protein [Streptomyces sp. JHD 1]MCX2971538.1 DUF397 domain-containing protein [Streptomyces sp. JHD 1]
MPGFEFRKSSYSSGSGECVEVATNVQGAVGIRDSKVAHGPNLRLAPAAWTEFLAHLREQSA